MIATYLEFMRIASLFLIGSFCLLLASCGDKRKNGAITQDGEDEIEALADELEEILRHGSESDFHDMTISQFATEEDYRLIFSEEIPDRIIEQMVFEEGLILEMLEAGTHKPGKKILANFRLGKYLQREEKSYNLKQLIENGRNDRHGFVSQQKRLGYWAEDEFFKPEVQFYEVLFSEPQIELPEAAKKWGPPDPRWGPYFWNGTSWKMLRLPEDSEVYIETEARIRNGRASEHHRKNEEKYQGMGAEERHNRKYIVFLEKSLPAAQESLREKEEELDDFLKQKDKRSQASEAVPEAEITKNRAKMEKQRGAYLFTEKRIKKLQSGNFDSKELQRMMRLRNQIFQEFKDAKKLDDHYQSLRQAQDPKAEEKLRERVSKGRESLRRMNARLEKARAKAGIK